MSERLLAREPHKIHALTGVRQDNREVLQQTREHEALATGPDPPNQVGAAEHRAGRSEHGGGTVAIEAAMAFPRPESRKAG